MSGLSCCRSARERAACMRKRRARERMVHGFPSRRGPACRGATRRRSAFGRELLRGSAGSRPKAAQLLETQPLPGARSGGGFSRCRRFAPSRAVGRRDGVRVEVDRTRSCASSLPWIVAAVFAVIVAEAMIGADEERVPVPRVADEPTCQKTLHACAPLTSDDGGVGARRSASEPIWKMNTALGLPCASSVTLPEESSSELLALRTPGRKT